MEDGNDILGKEKNKKVGVGENGFDLTNAVYPPFLSLSSICKSVPFVCPWSGEEERK